MKRTLLITLTTILSAQYSLMAMDVDAHKSAERQNKLALLSQTPARFIQVTCCNKAPANAFEDHDEVVTFKTALLDTLDSISAIPGAQGDVKSLTVNINGISHHPFFAQQENPRTRMLKLLESHAAKDYSGVKVFKGNNEVTMTDEQKRDLALGLFSAVNALEEDARGLVINLATLQRLPSCIREPKAEPAATVPPASQPQVLQPTWQQIVCNRTTAGVAITCLALGYLLRGQGTDQ